MPRGGCSSHEVFFRGVAIVELKYRLFFLSLSFIRLEIKIQSEADARVCVCVCVCVCTKHRW